MKIRFSFWAFFIFSFHLAAQQPKNIIHIRSAMFDPMASDIDTLSGVRGKTILSELDTLYLINPFGIREFIRCASELERCRQLSATTDDLETDLAKLQEGVNAMDKNIELFRDFTLKLQKENNQTIQELMQENKALASNLQTLEVQLEQARENLKTERRNSLMSKLLWGTGGFVAGTILVSAVVISIK